MIKISMKYTGIIRVRELPDNWTEEEFRYWWLPTRNSDGRVVKKPRLSRREKDRCTVYMAENLLTVGGRTTLLTYMGTTSGAPPFAAYFALGSGTIPLVTPQDTSLVSEYFRKQPVGVTVTGSQSDVSTYLGATEANGTITNVGFFGGSAATSTTGTGTLCTHSLFSYVKVNNVPVTIDYLMIQN